MFTMVGPVIFGLVVCVTLTGSVTAKYDPCCSFPCLNRGVCAPTRDYKSYTCDCTGQPYYGRNCETPTLAQRLHLMTQPSTETATYLTTNFPYLWYVLDHFEFFKRTLFKTFFLTKLELWDYLPIYTDNDQGYTTLDTAKDSGSWALILPPVPKNCPTPLGVKGKKNLPPVEEVVEKLFRRRKFIPSSLGANLMFAFVAQFMTHQALKPDFSTRLDPTWANHYFDGTQVYGKNSEEEDILRSKVHGKMKMQVLNGEEYPPYLKDAPMDTFYPDELNLSDKQKFAMGYKYFSVLPGLFLWNTILLREHNRICDILRKEHPQYDDERLYQTTKLIIIGIAAKIMTGEYFSSLGNFHIQIPFNPTMFHGEAMTYGCRNAAEFNHIWHQLIPDEFEVDGLTYSMDEYQYNNELVIKHGTRNFTAAITNQIAGEVSLYNVGQSSEKLVIETMQHLREIRTPSYNEFRKRFLLEPRMSIDDITDDEETRQILRELYGDAEGIEYFVGMYAEKRLPKTLFSVAMADFMTPSAIQGYFSSFIHSPHYWKPSTFGGNTGFELIKTTTLENLFCRNIPGDDCPPVFFRAPGYYPENNIPNEK